MQTCYTKAVPGNLYGYELLLGGRLCRTGPYMDAATIPLTHSMNFEFWEIEMDQDLLSLVTCFTARPIWGDFLRKIK